MNLFLRGYKDWRGISTYITSHGTEQGRKLSLSLAAMAKHGSALILSDPFNQNKWFEKVLNIYCEFKSNLQKFWKIKVYKTPIVFKAEIPAWSS